MMIRWKRLLAVAWVVSQTFLLGRIAISQENEKVALPESANTVVVVFDLTGGFRAPPPAGFDRTPFLQIFNDGKVLTGRNSPDQEAFTFKLDEKELQSLMQMIVNEQKFFAMNTQAITEQIDKSPQPVRIADAPSSEFTVRTKDKSNHVSVYALGLAANQLAHIDDVVRLVKIENRLRNIHSIATAGGPEKVAELTKLANEFLAKNHPKLPQLTADDLKWVTKTARLTQWSFVKPGPDSKKAAYSLNMSQKGAGYEFQINL